MIKIVTLAELEEMEAREDPALVFHGTSTCFTESIDANGWLINWRPHNWEDVQFVVSLCDRFNIGGTAFLYFNHDAQSKRIASGSGAFFTYILEGAVQYAGATGGETVRCGLRALLQIRNKIAGDTQHADIDQRLSALQERWEAWVRDSLPVVYAVRIEDDAFPDENFGGIVSRTSASFAYQRETAGQVLWKSGDFWAVKSIAASAIVAKAILGPEYIEDL